ncbi:MAG: carbon-nitrogen hydrolase family protein [Hyphomicrobiaceae bacterium]
MTKTLTVACVQNNASGTHQDNIAKAMAHVAAAAAKGAELVALPEYYSGFGSKDGRLDLPVFPESKHEGLAAAREAARAQKIWVLLGSIAVTLDDGRLANRGFMIDPTGRVTARYDKIHLFDVDLGPGKVYRESEVIRPGGEAVIAETPWGGIGLSICYDLRFAALYRTLAQAGAGILAIPAAFTKLTGEAHWHVLNRARAIEHGAFVIAPCQHGSFPGGGEAFGHSLIIDPWGRVLADGGEGEGIAMATLDLAEIAKSRSRIPALTHDRAFRIETVKAAAAE